MLQYSTLARNAMLDAIQYGANSGQTRGIGESAIIKLWTGSMPANCALADSGTMIAELDLAPSWASDASAGVKSFTFGRVVAVAPGTLGFFRIYASDGISCHMQGTITEPGGGGVMIIDGADMAWGQGITFAGFIIRAHGA